MGHGYGSWQEVCLVLPKWVIRSGDDSSGGRRGVRVRAPLRPVRRGRARLPRAVRCVVGSRATPCDTWMEMVRTASGVKPRAYKMTRSATKDFHAPTLGAAYRGKVAERVIYWLSTRR